MGKPLWHRSDRGFIDKFIVISPDSDFGAQGGFNISHSDHLVQLAPEGAGFVQSI